MQIILWHVLDCKHQISEKEIEKKTYKMVRMLFLKQIFYDMLVSVKYICNAFLSLHTLLRHISKTRAG